MALTAAAVGVSALTFGLTATASAAPARPLDTGARSGDVVGVGSDTLQNAANFVLDGSAENGGSGYNLINNKNRVFDFDANGDANGRGTYDGTCGLGGTDAAPARLCSSTNSSQNPNLLYGTAILRSGDNPVVRPNGSGQGIAALTVDSPGGNATTTTSYEGLPQGSIQYARASRLPNSGEEANCPTKAPGTEACDGLHVYQVATDQLQIAHLASGYDGPSGLSLSDLVGIYQCTIKTWSQVPGYSGSAGSATIHPLIPQSGSGTRNFFLADLTAANNGTTVNPQSCVGTVEEHDPDGIYEDPSPADAIEPFSTGKITLINSGYFTNGNTTAGVNGAPNTSDAFAPGLLTSDASSNSADGGKSTAYSDTRGLYFVLREEDVQNYDGLSAFQPGGAATATFANSLFVGPTAYANRSAQAGDYAAAGFTQSYKDCGINPTSC